MAGACTTSFSRLTLALAVLTAGCAPRRVERPPEPVAARPEPRSLVGAGSCTSSGCHAAPAAGHAAWQSAYTIWATRDPHAHAHEVLRGPLAERIVAAVVARDPALPQPPAHENMACVGCHATGRGPTAGEGVSCESCHGPAGPWLVAHAATGWKTRGNTLGMLDLADPFVCSTTCADCHVGGAPTTDGAIREVTHDLVAAGHPRLAFELRGYKRAQPPHWHDRFAAPPDAQSPGPLDEWAQGRLGALANYLRQTAAQSQAAATGDRGITAGVWPEFTAFDCHGCHRPAALGAAGPARLRAPRPAGFPRLEPMYWTHLDVLAPAGTREPLLQIRDTIGRSWVRVPAAASLAAAIRAVDDARAGLHERLASRTAADLAHSLAEGTDAANWAEAVSALGGLEAIADREAAAGRLVAGGEVPRRLAGLRRLLEFPIESAGGTTERFASPRGYEPAAVADEIRSIAKAFEAGR